jgi:hypothetical protein
MALSPGIVRTTAGGGLVTAFPIRAFAITASDATVFEQPVAVRVGTSGAVAVEPWEGGNTVTYASIADGDYVPVMVRRVLSTGTTASNLTGQY